MMQRCAVIGVGQTKHATARGDVSIKGLVREAIHRAFEDSGLDWRDVDLVVLGKAPDMFEGVMMPELYLADALGAVGKPIVRVNTAGSVGGSTGVAATHAVASGLHGVVLAVAFEKQSEGEGLWALSPNVPFQPAVRAGAGSSFAPFVRLYMSQTQAPADTGIKVALKDRLNALRNPYAHVQIEDISYEMIAASDMLWDPIRYLESCPSSDGACALVLASEDHIPNTTAPPAWVHGTALRSEPRLFAGRNIVSPQAGQDCAAELYRSAGIQQPAKEIDLAEVYVPFSWFEPMWLENLGLAEQGRGWEFVEDGRTEIEGDMPINPSGGVIATNPIGASGMLRFAEAAMQVRGQAGDHQVDGAETALGHAFGGLSAYFAMWLVSSTKP